MNDQLTLWNLPVVEQEPTQKPLTRREQLFQWGKDNGFPELSFPCNGLEAYQAKGESNWQAILDAPDWVRSRSESFAIWVECALKAVQA